MKKIEAFSEEQVKKTMENNVDFISEETKKQIKTARLFAVNDCAVRLMQKDKNLTLNKALELAELEVPKDEMPETIKNLRISSNYCGTMWAFMEGIRSEVQRLGDMFEIVNNSILNKYYEEEATKIRLKQTGE